MHLKFRHIFLICVVLTSYSLKGQRYFGIENDEFGKNRIQSKRFEWKTIKSNNFEFNFYRGGEEIARKAAKKAESEYEHITEILGYTPFSVMKIFIYNNLDDAKQSNIGLSAPTELDGGILNLTKARIEISYQKNDSLFYNKLIKEITTLFVYDMLYGGSLKEAVQSQLLLMVPEWFLEGIAGYIAESNNASKFETYKNAIIKLDKSKISHLEGEDAKIIGQSIWNYIELKYGKDNISNILNLTRIIRNEQSSITSTLGISFNKFLKEWKAFYVNNENSNLKTEKTENLLLNETKTEIVEGLKNLKDGEIDTDFYNFEEKNTIAYKERKSTTEFVEGAKFENRSEKYKRTTDELKLSAVKAYQNLLVANDNNVEVLIDPARRFGLGTKMVLNDLLENHIITLKAYLRPSTPLFKNYDYSIGYDNYAHKLDYKFKYEKRSINFESIDKANDYLFRPLKVFPLDGNTISLSRRLMSQKITAGVSYPFSEYIKFEFNPSYFKTTDIDYEVPSGRDNLNEFYLISEFNAVFDNTKSISKNVQLGSKAKISFEKNINFGNNLQSFDRINLDARHYQRLTKGLVLAGRLTFSKSMGNAPKFSYIGGVENWVNRSIYNAQGLLPGSQGNYSDILFYNFTGSLRGFDFARLFGNNHLLSNIELRASLSEYFPKSSLSSTFLRNLQFVLFNDLGTAWNGNKGPLSRQNSLNTIVIGTDGISPFFAEVTNFKNPFLMGFGGGIRTTILGFIIKADYAFGREDQQISKPKLHISLGSDF